MNTTDVFLEWKFCNRTFGDLNFTEFILSTHSSNSNLTKKINLADKMHMHVV